MTTTMDQASQTFTVTEEILVCATLEKTFASLIAQMGRSTKRQTASRCRWSSSRDRGAAGTGTLAATTDIYGVSCRASSGQRYEIWGRLFMSTAATSNLMYRLTEVEGGSLITFTHTVVGPFPEDHRPQLATGWAALHARVRKAAETNSGE